MYKSHRTLSYILILIILCLTVCNRGMAVNSFKKTGEFSCKGHQCGCKSESDCKIHCCCGHFQYKRGKQKNGLQSFISSVNCKFGDNPVSGITFSAKYILESNVMPINESFLCFLPHGTSIYLPDIFVSPPEKPPRNFI